MAAGEMELLLIVDGYDVDRDIEMTMILMPVKLQEHDLGGGEGGMPSEFDEIATIKAFKILGEGVGTIRSEEEDVIDKTQPEVWLLESGMKEVCSWKLMNKLV